VDFEFPTILGEFGRFAVCPAPRPADGHDPRADRVFQPTERTKPPEDLILGIHHDVLVVNPLLGQVVGVGAEIAGVDYLVPQIERPGAMPDENDDGLGESERRLDGLRGRPGGGVEEEGVGLGGLDGVGGLVA